MVGATAPVGGVAVGAGDSDLGAGELVGVLTDPTEVWDETGVAVVLVVDGGGAPGGVARPGAE